MKKASRRILLSILVLLIFSTCNKDIKLLDDYKDTTIVYGLINPNDSISYIRIEKAFFTGGDVFEAVQIQDSNQFNYKLDVKLIQGKKTITFDTITIFNKEDGIFYAPKMLMYYAVTKDLLNTTDSLYLEIFNPKTKEYTTSSTFLHNGLLINYVYPILTIAFENEYYIQFKSLPNTRQYKLDLRFNYMEQIHDDESSREYKYIDWAFPIFTTSNSYGDEVVKFFQYGETFYDLVVEHIKPTDVLERYFGSIELKITSGDNVLKNYVDTHRPGASLVSGQQEYTNIKNGYGVFAARSGTEGFYRLHLTTIYRLQKLKELNFIGSIREN